MKFKFNNKQTKKPIFCKDSSGRSPPPALWSGILAVWRLTNDRPAAFLRGNVPLSLRPELLLECRDITEISIYVLPEQRAHTSERPTSSVRTDWM